EFTDDWIKPLKEGLPDYPYSIIEKRTGGIALFSRVPLIDSMVLFSGKKQRPRIETHVNLDGRRTTVIFAHPFAIGRLEMRNAELREIAAEARGTSEPVILFGDLNCSPWSYYFAKLVRDSRLQDTERGFGVQPTWSTHFLLPVIPIDHCLTSDQFV